MKSVQEIRIEEYDYELPESSIALFPKEKRDSSNLLAYKKGTIHHHTFTDLPNLLEEECLIYFNNSKVINARLWFRKPTGSVIEVFCLEPTEEDMAVSLSSVGQTKWNCYIRGAKKWKSGPLSQVITINGEDVTLEVHKGPNKEDYFEVDFNWEGSFTFSEILETAGRIPLPPYIERESEDTDLDRYQTVYAEDEGSVAAPTAGLHFTDTVLKDLKERGHDLRYLTLHVGAGTFKPVTSENIGNHYMHEECFEVSFGLIKELFENNKAVVAVGTTSVRTLESLYWLGCKCAMNPEKFKADLQQWEIYEPSFKQISVKEALKALMRYLEENQLNALFGSTKLIIAPGYIYRIVRALITNFHLPKSTLLLLVSALIGENWKEVYKEALEKDYRFLSYGDSSLLWP